MVPKCSVSLGAVDSIKLHSRSHVTERRLGALLHAGYNILGGYPKALVGSQRWLKSNDSFMSNHSSDPGQGRRIESGIGRTVEFAFSWP